MWPTLNPLALTPTLRTYHYIPIGTWSPPDALNIFAERTFRESSRMLSYRRRDGMYMKGTTIGKSQF